MVLKIRRLGPKDEGILKYLSLNDSEYDLDGRGAPLSPLIPAKARKYLSNSAVYHWVAIVEKDVVGFLYCALVPLRYGSGQEFLLYEIGVKKGWRRMGIGRALLIHMEKWMSKNRIKEVWVCADNEIAVRFYKKTGFTRESDQPIYMTKVVKTDN
jgi:ribosomal protein S18 acetylase RimI-like enzyme